MNLTNGSFVVVFSELIVINLAKLQGDFTKMTRSFFNFLILIILLIFNGIYLYLIKESVVN